LIAFIRRNLASAAATSPWEGSEPIREELMSIERLEQHARTLAAAQHVTPKPVKVYPLARRVVENAARLLQAHHSIATSIEENYAITPAAEWLIDNFHLVESQIRQIRSDLPPGYYRQLPKLAEGPFAGYPRVFGVAWAYVAHTDSRFDPEIFCRYLQAYQEVDPLTIGELWAVSITLRIVLTENLRRLADRVMQSGEARKEADELVRRLVGAVDRAPEPAAALLSAYGRTPLPRALAVQLVHRLHDQDPRIAPVLAWLDGRLAAQNTTADALVRDEHQRQGSASVTVRNIILSLRLIADVDWTELFERVSPVDRILSVTDHYLEMDFPTRNLYRTAIEVLARGSPRSELDIARSAVLAALNASAADARLADSRRADPGYHLIAGGRRAFEALIGYRPPPNAWFGRLGRNVGIGGYVGAGAILGALLLAIPLWVSARVGFGGGWLVLFAWLGIIPAIDLAVALINRGVTRGFRATRLPAMELREGIPDRLRTLIAVPTLLSSIEGVREQVERLEIHYLASTEGDLHYALLSDWTDADSEHRAGDKALLDTAAGAIEELNRRHGPAPDGARFLLLHRRRIWNEREGRWIGWERKRGKLHELNRLLRGATDTTFLPIAGRLPRVPANVRYVITLDADTRLPRESVRRLIGKMAHPLNAARFDPRKGRVVEGYAILQPRVTPSLPVGREGSVFQRIFSSVGGIDSYASAVSDVYQDLFGEGSYTGKGIYDVDAFEAALAGRAPDSTLLSHDLFEGVFARAGLASDIEVIEEFPSRYDVAAIRHHRWARGDWQLLPWILGLRSVALADPVRNRMPAIGRWKMLDNLRRTFSAPAAVACLVAGWMLSVPMALTWTGFILATIGLPTFIPVVNAMASRRPGVPLQRYMRTLGGDIRTAFTLWGLIITFLAHQAWLMGDAVLRTLYRLFVSRRHLLEWVPAAQASLGLGRDLGSFYRRMFGAVLIGVAAFLLSLLSESRSSAVALPFALLWSLSPAIARWSSLSPLDTGEPPVLPADAEALRLVARRTWRFFESFVTPADNMLPPDNFQEDPKPVLAHRTSPTNIGLYLLSTVSARDFGWIGTLDAIERMEATFETMDRLKRFRGHFFNWYDTQDLRPLDPAYISSVDSGNLAGHLIALANACREWRERAVADARIAGGIGDALELARREANRLRQGSRQQLWLPLEDALVGLRDQLRRLPREGEAAALPLSALAAAADVLVEKARNFGAERPEEAGADLLFWAEAARRTIEGHRHDRQESANRQVQLLGRLVALEERARATALGMEFGFLLDRDRKLLSIGYLVPEGTLDPSCYDLLASEARLASFIAIAKGDVEARHWFHLGRTVTPIASGAALISWSGSMFEYLMPSLVMRAPTGSLIQQTNRLAVRKQIDYATEAGVPWGISESAYNARDLEYTYQYSNFGIPSLGMKRGLGENFVVSPYATALASMVDPPAAATNLERLAKLGARGRYGFYEALDFTSTRLPEGENVAIVRAYMAHHQGMTIVAIANALLEGEVRSRFHEEPMVRATELLLQERTPRDVAVVRPWVTEGAAAAKIHAVEPPGGRRYTSAHDPAPATHLLSNGRYSLMLTSAGSGYSRWRDIAVTRWREDATCDDWGSYLYLRDIRSGAVWSAGYQPIGAEADDYEAAFNEDRAEIVRRDGALVTSLEVLVSQETDGEVRRVSIANAGVRAREIDITSYAELALAPQASDVAHPAFSKLFVETEYLPELEAVVATRRRRSQSEPEIWAGQLAIVDGEAIGELEIETDRARFLGRENGPRAPNAVLEGKPLSNTTGTVLDPIFALRRRVRVRPGAIARVAFWTLVASSREALLDLIDKHRDVAAFERAATLAWTQAQVQLHHLKIDSGEAASFQSLAGHLLYATPAMRPASDTIRRGAGGQPGLWPHGISGDLPILLQRISDTEDLGALRQVLLAHEYWRLKRFAVDLVILNERAASYVQDLQIAIEGMVRTGQTRAQVEDNGPAGRVFVLRADLIPDEARSLLLSIARVVLVAQRGRISDQLDRAVGRDASFGPAPRRAAPPSAPALVPTVPELEFYNGLGGFDAEGRDYVTVLRPGQTTPAPWCNVIANPTFGFQVSAGGGGYSWSRNGRENQLTPWSNDPVTDRPGEVFYLRDEESGETWTPTATPIREPGATYVARHGYGYSRLEHIGHEIQSELLLLVPLTDPIKISRLRFRNGASRHRRIAVTAYAEWVLGASRGASAPFVTTEIDTETGALFARNRWNPAFGSRVAFSDMAGRQSDWTGDRREFIGRNGSLSNPAALAEGRALSKRVGAGLDPCAALRTVIDLAPNETVEIVHFLGEAESEAAARALVAKYRATDLDEIRTAVARHWDDFLGMIEVRTPDRALDIMLNGWLLYQTLVCRLWSRSGFYQASGAYGFRDQLQDCMSITFARPAMTREHLLRAASRQFPEGDVQHWWLPHSGQGVRTRISDDRAWLGYAAALYVEATGDSAVLDAQVPFLEGQRLAADEHDSFFQPKVSDETASLFEHCARALDQSLAVGPHGLPLIGGGDWNDGMNRVGEKGRGESVWLGWLLYATLMKFAPIAEARGEASRTARWRDHAKALQRSIEREAWDGDWYKRAWYDDGTPLGSAANDECRIDSIAQSWAVLSGAGDNKRTMAAMQAAERELVRREDALALLFAPPFDKIAHDPGYIRGYPPGIRENGGQYTHAGLWSVLAWAALGEGDKAAGLLAMLNPINHARTPADLQRYKVEPYVVAADIYAAPSHVGRGGWTWYTGSAGWMHRAGIEGVLGLRLKGDHFTLEPAIPASWPGYEMTLRFRSATYEILVENPGNTDSGVAEFDGEALPSAPWSVPLLDDGATHRLRVTLGRPARSSATVENVAAS